MMGFSIILRVALLTLCVTLITCQWPPSRRRPAFGRFPLDKACRTVGPNNVTLSEKACPGCGTCTIGPIRTRVNGTVIAASFCRYRNPMRNIQQRACLIQDDGTNALIKMRNCGFQQQCTLGPIYMKLPNTTAGRLYLCASTRPNVQYRPVAARQRQPNVDLFQIMVNESCMVVNTSTNTMTRKDCCLNCSTSDPVIITMDNHRLQLYLCLDDNSNSTGIPRRKPARPFFPRWGHGGGQGGRLGGLGGRLGGMMGRFGSRLGGMMGGYGGRPGGQRRPVGTARPRAGPGRPRGWYRR